MHDRVLIEKGRPKTQCAACQQKRELTGGHAKCNCAKVDGERQRVGTAC